MSTNATDPNFSDDPLWSLKQRLQHMPVHDHSQTAPIKTRITTPPPPKASDTEPDLKDQA